MEAAKLLEKNVNQALLDMNGLGSAPPTSISVISWKTTSQMRRVCRLLRPTLLDLCYLECLVYK
ncbi:hypothetical protein GH733_014384 [Mirounga leonina]|nr:hypothetical protein GH733_014384 [Mirounga leonina]